MHAPPPSSRATRKFVVQSSDVLHDMRVNVFDAQGATLLWYKERYLGEDEICEHVVDNATNTILWVIHRPKRGWYIRMRAPTFPRGTFIPFAPVHKDSPHHTEGALTLAAPTLGSCAADDASPCPATPHSYPPSPAAVVVHPPPASLAPWARQITRFLLAPAVPEHPPANASLLRRALAVLNAHRPKSSNSFTLSRMSPPPSSSSLPPYDGPDGAPASRLGASISAMTLSSTTALNSSVGAPSSSDAPPLRRHALLTYHDRTPVLAIRSHIGTIEIDTEEERLLGADSSFWVATALTYLEFLEDRDGYLAALSD